MDEMIKLLIVDDNVDFLETLAQRLAMRGVEVKTATSGARAIEICNAEPFDLALVDLKIPEMDGQEVLKRLKAEHHNLEVIILTGHGSFGSAVECAKLGAFDYLPKPYDLDSLLEILRKAYAERLRNKFRHDQERLDALIRIAQHESPLGILRRMKELDRDSD